MVLRSVLTLIGSDRDVKIAWVSIWTFDGGEGRLAVLKNVVNMEYADGLRRLGVDDAVVGFVESDVNVGLGLTNGLLERGGDMGYLVEVGDF